MNGSGYLSTVYALINGAINAAGGCFVYYVPATNALYLYNDAGSSAAGPLAPGSSGTLANSQCTLNGTGSSASGAGNTLTVAFSITFKPAFSTLQNVYGYAADSGGNVSGWQLLGTWTGAAPPAPMANSVSPASGAGVSQTFAFKYSSVNGSGYLSTVYGLINGAINAAGGCFVYYVPATNALYLYNDAGSSAAGPLAPGSSGTLANSQCTLNGAGSSASGAGNTLTVAFSITFKPAFSSLQNVYGYAADSGGNVSGWQLLGTWTGAAPPAPTANSVSPASGTGVSQTFTFKYSSVNGSGYLSTVYGLISGAINAAGGCFVYYVPATNALYLYNDAGSSAAGPLAPGSSGTLANSQCTLNGTGSSASGAGNTLTVAFSITFKPAFSTLQNVYGYAADSGGNVSGWQLLGTWTAPTPGPDGQFGQSGFGYRRQPDLHVQILKRERKRLPEHGLRSDQRGDQCGWRMFRLLCARDERTVPVQRCGFVRRGTAGAGKRRHARQQPMHGERHRLVGQRRRQHTDGGFFDHIQTRLQQSAECLRLCRRQRRQRQRLAVAGHLDSIIAGTATLNFASRNDPIL